MATQPLALSAQASVPLSHFAPGKPAASNPFVWVSPRPATPFIDSKPAANWAALWQPARRIPAAVASRPAAESWQPAPVNENAPLPPPDGIPLAGGPSPLPGISIAAGNCVITGEVSDATSLNPLAGAFVDVVGAGRSAETDADGRFTIGGLPAGTYTLEATKLGYSTESSVITALDGQPAQARFGLRIKPAGESNDETLLEEETVVGDYQGESQGDFVLDIEATQTIQSGLGQEDFAKAAVSDAGEALEKVSGANVVDGAFAVVRGLADRYVDTTFNSGAISSAVPSRKAVRLDLFPTSTLEALTVDKLYLPYLTGDFGGASIDIKTRTFPDKPIVDFKLKYEFNPSLPDQMLLPADAELKYFNGLGVDTIPVDDITGPDGFLISGPTSPSPGNASDAEAAKNAWATLFDTRELKPTLRDSIPEESFSTTLGNTFNLTDGIKLGVLAAGGMKSEDEYNSSPVVRANGVTLDQEDFTRQQEWNIYSAAGLRLGDFNELTYIYFRKNITQHNVTKGENIVGGEYGDIGDLSGTRPFYGADAFNTGNFMEIDPVEQDLEIRQLAGKHRMGERGPSIEWALTDSDALEDRPNYSIFRYTTLDFGAQEQFQQVRNQANQRFFDEIGSVFPDAPEFQNLAQAGAYLISQGLPPAAVAGLLGSVQNQYPVVDESLGKIDTLPINAFTGEAAEGNPSSRTIQSINENTYDQKIKLDFPYYFSEDNEDRGVRFGVGLSRTEKSRQARGVIYDLIPEFKDAAGNNSQGLPEDLLVALGPEFVNNPQLLEQYITGYTAGAPYYFDDTLGGILNLVNNVDGFHDIEAHFLSGEFFWNDFFFKGGARYENELRTAEILPPTPDLPPELLNIPPISDEVLLPSVAIGYKAFDDKLSLIGAWSRTASRPTFYEWLPTRSIDLSTGIVRLGNPLLVNSEITNIDIAAQWDFNGASTLRVGFFTKDIVDPIIEERLDPNTIAFSNGDLGQISGLEIECDIKEAGPFSLTANLTYIGAELEYTVESPATGLPVSTTERFPYQPEWIFNLNIGYEKKEWDLDVNLIYNFTGEYLTVLRRVDTDANLQQQPLHSVDLVVRKGLGDPEGRFYWTIGGGVKNLFATDRDLVWKGGTLDGLTNQTFEAQRSYFIEAKCAF